MKKFLAVILAVTMLTTMLAVSVGAESILGSDKGVLPDNFTTETTPGQDLNVKVSDITHKYAVDIIFSLGVLDLGGNITWNVNTMKYEVGGNTLENTSRTVTVNNRSDLPVYAYATITDPDDADGITVAAANSAESKLTVAKATAGSGAKDGTSTVGELAINLTSDDWNAVAEYYAAKRLNSPDQATDKFRIATVTVTITKE